MALFCCPSATASKPAGLCYDPAQVVRRKERHMADM
jgi:hypothetical protein